MNKQASNSKVNNSNTLSNLKRFLRIASKVKIVWKR